MNPSRPGVHVAFPSPIPSTEVPPARENPDSTDVRFIRSVKPTAIGVVGRTSVAFDAGYRYHTAGAVRSASSVVKRVWKSSVGEPCETPLPFPSRRRFSRSTAVFANTVNRCSRRVLRFGYGSNSIVSSGKRVPLHEVVPFAFVRVGDPDAARVNEPSTLALIIALVKTMRTVVEIETFVAPFVGPAWRTRGGAGSAA